MRFLFLTTIAVCILIDAPVRGKSCYCCQEELLLVERALEEYPATSEATSEGSTEEVRKTTQETTQETTTALVAVEQKICMKTTCDNPIVCYTAYNCFTWTAKVVSYGKDRWINWLGCEEQPVVDREKLCNLLKPPNNPHVDRVEECEYKTCRLGELCNTRDGLLSEKMNQEQARQRARQVGTNDFKSETKVKSGTTTASVSSGLFVVMILVVVLMY